jgi:general secretion pathway protein G
MSITSRTTFTFLELAVYAVLLSITLLLAGYFYRQVETEPERQLRIARADITLLGSALGAYTLDTGNPLPTAQTGGLDVLVQSGYLSAIPLDPYGNAYIYTVPGQYSGRPFEIHSLGPDGKQSEDDIISWNLYGKRLLTGWASAR